MHRRKVLAAVAAGLITIGAAGCGDDDVDPDPGDIEGNPGDIGEPGDISDDPDTGLDPDIDD